MFILVGLKFLMHRVELKATFLYISFLLKNWFLMHRVELKEEEARRLKEGGENKFLMHRVELKVSSEDDNFSW